MNKPHLPAWLDKYVTDGGGLAPGGLPNFRICWGGDRLTIMGGKWRDHNPNTGALLREVVEYRHLPKYPQAIERWIFEMWTPPELTREQWAAVTSQFIDGQLIECLGPYPSEGEYELVKILETPSKRFVPLTQTICDVLIATAKFNKHIPKQRRVEANRRRFEAEEKAKDDRLMGKIKELGQAEMALVPHIVVPSSFEKEKYSE